MGILILILSNLLLTSILVFRFSLLIYIFNLIFVGRLFLLILFVLSIRRLIQTTFNFNIFKLLVILIVLLNFSLSFQTFNNMIDFNLSFTFILGFIILLVFLIFCILVIF